MGVAGRTIQVGPPVSHLTQNYFLSHSENLPIIPEVTCGYDPQQKLSAIYHRT